MAFADDVWGNYFQKSRICRLIERKNARHIGKQFGHTNHLTETLP
jgi:hypothetical protein